MHSFRSKNTESVQINCGYRLIVVIRLCYSNPIIGFCIEKWWNLRLDSPDSLDTYLSKRFRRGSISSADLLWSRSGQFIILNSFNSIVRGCASNWRLFWYSCIRTRKDRCQINRSRYIEIGNIFKKFLNSFWFRYKFEWIYGEGFLKVLINQILEFQVSDLKLIPLGWFIEHRVLWKIQSNPIFIVTFFVKVYLFRKWNFVLKKCIIFRIFKRSINNNKFPGIEIDLFE